jgi:putative peptidoglycan lipid II flippase
MVRRVFSLVYKEVRGLHQAAYVLALFAFGSQLLALVRDRLLAHQFGAGSELDIYYTAFRIPDLLFVIFASTLSVYVLIPFVSKARAVDEKAGGQVLSQVFSVFLIFYVVLSLVILFFAPAISHWLFPELADQSSLVMLMRILLLQPLLLGISSLFGVVTQLGHRFVLYALSPLIYNLGIIIGIILLEPLFGLSGLAYGVVLGAFGHMLIQWPLVDRSLLRFGFTFEINWSEIRKILQVSVPRAFTLSLNQLVLLLFVSVASTFVVGSVSVFQFAYNLQSVPLAVIGVSYSVAAFPILADLFTAKKLDLFNFHITTALRHIIFWSLPVIALLVVLRAQVVRVILGSGEFDWSDTRLTAAVLALLSVSLIFQAVNLLATRSFYAAGNTRMPLISAVLGAGSAVVSVFLLLDLFKNSESFQTLLTSLMRVETMIGSEVLILGLAYSIGVCVQMLCLLFFLRQTFSLSLTWLPWHLLRSLVAAVLGGGTAYLVLNFLVAGINSETLIGIFVQGLLAGVCGIGAVVFTYYILRSPELTEVFGAFQKRLFKVDVVASEEDII